MHSMHCSRSAERALGRAALEVDLPELQGSSAQERPARQGVQTQTRADGLLAGFVVSGLGKCQDIAVEKCRLAAVARPASVLESCGSQLRRSNLAQAQAQEHVKGPVMCEDTSLCYHALKDLPGQTARRSGQCYHGGARKGERVARSIHQVVPGEVGP